MSAIESVHRLSETPDGFWKCEKCSTDTALVMNTDDEKYCRSCGKSRKGNNTSVSLIAKPTQNASERPQRDLSISSGVSSAKAQEKPKLSKSRIALSDTMPVALPKTKRQRSQKWLYKGIILDSTEEKERMLYLETLEERGIISGLIRPEAIEIRARLVVPANDIHDEFVQARERYTPDFAYSYNGYFIIEDVKGKRWIKYKDKPNVLKPKLEKNVPNKIKRLQEMLVQHPKRVFLLTVYHGGMWHYFNSNQNEIEFSLEALEMVA